MQTEPHLNQVDPYGVAHFLACHQTTAWTSNWGHGNARIICEMNKGLSPAAIPAGRLFFLDEATAFAAGFRPCAGCRPERADAFLSRLPEVAHAGQLDQRIANSYGDIRLQSSHLPAGTMVDICGFAHIVRADGQVAPWWATGYGPARPMPDRYHVLTPELQLEALRNGYEIQIHDSVHI